MPTPSASGSGANAERLAFRRKRRSTGCARRRAGGWPKLAVRRQSLPLSAATPPCGKCHATLPRQSRSGSLDRESRRSCERQPEQKLSNRPVRFDNLGAKVLKLQEQEGQNRVGAKLCCFVPSHRTAKYFSRRAESARPANLLSEQSPARRRRHRGLRARRQWTAQGPIQALFRQAGVPGAPL